jgi:hypothetical protein
LASRWHQKTGGFWGGPSQEQCDLIVLDLLQVLDIPTAGAVHRSDMIHQTRDLWMVCNRKTLGQYPHQNGDLASKTEAYPSPASFPSKIETHILLK